jgi:hypothetical protein
MTTTNQISGLRDALALAERLAGTFAERTEEADLNKVDYTGKAPLSALPVADLAALIDRGHLVDLHVRADPWRLHLRRGGTDGDVTDSDGPIAAAVDQARIDALDNALVAGEFDDIVALLQAHDAEVTLRVINRPNESGTHWIATHTAMNEVLSSALWVPFARQLATGPTGLLVDDLGTVVLTTEALTVYGPDSPPPAVLQATRRTTTSQSDAEFRKARAGQNEPYPSPFLFGGLTQEKGDKTPATASTISAFNRLTYVVTWALLATSSHPINGGIHVAVSGARELDIDIHPATDPETNHLVDLYRWVATSPEIDRLYFTQQALTLAVVTAADVQSAAEPALRTAKSLYDLSRRNSVAEVMAARRSAREIALAASRSAATQARESASKAVERTVLQVAAAAAVIIAQVQKALSPGQAAGLLALIAGLCVLSLVVTETVTLHSARTGLTRELEDLDRYRDSLSEEDVADTKKVGAITAAKVDLSRARATIWLTFGLAAIVLIIVAVVFWADAGSEEHDGTPEAPTPSSSTNAQGAPATLAP